MKKPVKVAKVCTLLLLWGSVGWFLLCMGSAAMQTSIEHQQEVMRLAWPPFVLAGLAGISLLMAASRSHRWRILARLGWWTLGTSAVCITVGWLVSRSS